MNCGCPPTLHRKLAPPTIIHSLDPFIVKNTSEGGGDVRGGETESERRREEETERGDGKVERKWGRRQEKREIGRGRSRKKDWERARESKRRERSGREVGEKERKEERSRE